MILVGSAAVGAEIEDNVVVPIPSSGNKYIDATIEAILGIAAAYGAHKIGHDGISLFGIGAGGGFAFKAVLNAIF